MAKREFDFDSNATPHYAVVDKDICKKFPNYDGNFLTLAFHKGKVLSLEEYEKYHNEGKDLNDTIRYIELYDKCWEVCAECGEEVMLDTKFCMQVCPICGKPIAPCNLCGGNCITPCPLGRNQ